MQNFLAGIYAYSRALQLIRSLRLWSFFFIPALISVLLAIVIFSVAWYLADDLGGWLAAIYPWDWGKTAVEKISNIFGAILVVAIGLILYKNLVMGFASPFMSKLSERIEKVIRPGQVVAGGSAGRVAQELVRGLLIALRNITRELFFTLLLLLVGLIPVISPVIPFAIILVQAYYAGFGSMDYTLERHLRTRASIRFVRQHRGLAIGNGLIFILLLMTGIGFLFALPLSTVAATPEVLKRLPVRP